MSLSSESHSWPICICYSFLSIINMKLLILIVFTLFSCLYSQTCTKYAYNQSCYDAGAGRCCSCWGSPQCAKGIDYCCGDCGGCMKGQSCCSRGPNDFNALCLEGYHCCEPFKDFAYYCPPDYSCCGDGVCCKPGTQLAGWVIALLVVSGVCIVASVGFFIYQLRKKRKEEIDPLLIKDHMQ